MSKLYTYRITEHRVYTGDVKIAASSREAAERILWKHLEANPIPMKHDSTTKASAELVWEEDDLTRFSEEINEKAKQTTNAVIDKFCANCACLYPELINTDDGNPCEGCKVRELVDALYYGHKEG